MFLFRLRLHDLVSCTMEIILINLKTATGPSLSKKHFPAELAAKESWKTSNLQLVHRKPDYPVFLSHFTAFSTVTNPENEIFVNIFYVFQTSFVSVLNVINLTKFLLKILKYQFFLWLLMLLFLFILEMSLE